MLSALMCPNWGPLLGSHFGTASHDRTSKLFKQDGELGAAEGYAGLAYVEVKEFSFRGPAECLAFTPEAVAMDAAEMLVCSRDDHRLHLVNLGTQATRHFNLNANGDEWVSFTVRFQPHPHPFAFSPSLPAQRAVRIFRPRHCLG